MLTKSDLVQILPLAGSKSSNLCDCDVQFCVTLRSLKAKKNPQDKCAKTFERSVPVAHLVDLVLWLSDADGLCVLV